MQKLLCAPDIQLYLDQVPTDWPPESFLLSENEMAYCLKSHRRELQLSRAKLRLMVKKIFDSAHVEVVSGELGRPHVLPDWDVSFSHKNAKALVGLVRAPDRLGVDLESLWQKIDWSVFSGHCFLDQEQNEIQKLAQLSGWNEDSANLGFFSLKEAFFKAVNSPFIPADVCLAIQTFENGTVFLEISHKGQKQRGATCFILKTADEVISICHLRANL